MGVKISKKDYTLIVKIDGELDHHQAESVKKTIDEEYEKKDCKNIIFDLKNLTFMDSSGIGVIIGRYKKVKNNGGKVAIANTGQHLKKLIEVSGLLRIIKCYNSLEEAIKDM
ncbi:anti-sigma F factor antagonist [Caldanaerobacter sp.]|uniref:anti-sigma F factor antagonist n=1 Tax=Caldanaerobacter sp. TaxID=2930036 RepID=UPI003C73219A